MDLHFLINISSETENLYGVRFFRSFFGECATCDITLFHIYCIRSDSSPSLLDMWQKPEQQLEEKLSIRTQRAMNTAKRILQENNSRIFEMKTKTVEETYGKVNDILIEAEKGLYDAMILGRRVTYALQWLFDRTATEIPIALTQKKSLNSPLWICSEPEEGRKDVLVCVDGSASSYRAADHVGYILQYAQHHNVTIFHVATTRTTKTLHILNQAEKIVLSHGIDRERITTKRGWGLSIPGAILGEKNAGKYAAVAIGLHGVNETSILQRIGLTDGITSTLIKKISKAALWCCP